MPCLTLLGAQTPFAQRIVHTRLPAFSGGLEIRNDFEVVAHRDCQLGRALLRPAPALVSRRPIAYAMGEGNSRLLQGFFYPHAFALGE